MCLCILIILSRNYIELITHLGSCVVLLLVDADVGSMFQVIPGALLRSCKSGPHFRYSLLGCPVHTDPIADVGECEFPAERANAKVLTTPFNLAKYFRQQKSIVITLLIGEIELAQCSVDLMSLLSESPTQSNLILPKKIEGTYNFIPVKGNTFGGSSSSSADAALGVSIELEQTALPFNIGASTSTLSQPSETNETEDRLKRLMGHLNEVSMEYESLESKKTNESSTHGANSLNASRNGSLSLSASRQYLKEQLKPPAKKRKLNEDGEEKLIYSGKGDKDDWAAAEEDLQQWRRAQENIFWKQVCTYLV